MEISQSTASPQFTKQDSGKTKISSDFDTFLKMLTTQMQNQDPLNPIDSSDYAVQLATFSSVEQQTLTNQKLDALAGLMNMQGMAQLAPWVGQEARTTAPVYLSGAPVSVSPTPNVGADRAVLVASDAAGNVVAREDIPLGDAPYLWHGQDITGAPVPAGAYTLSLESYREGEQIAVTPVTHYARIEEVQTGPAGHRLVLTGGITIAAQDVSGLRGGV
ncbi:flagellar hook capping FlgD N-terminal domain-containing protein [Pseudorhodobacter sp.]|uniref:flagellar hook capping FlgD N-terminal domain-containing protein n=1 Tax=Pseudorhodobacter sp. TaxID=1934400 RepID=UPI00264785CC|nr:flagellar hook capping FlgD N-terminal domain-containing protein [Pseudorhodobacter sp.]MDN5787031.1 flagellar hook assembly protein FlgD [Pseudorhodobacter sp.]